MLHVVDKVEAGEILIPVAVDLVAEAVVAVEVLVVSAVAVSVAAEQGGVGEVSF